jgi:hypothetical protein
MKRYFKSSLLTSVLMLLIASGLLMPRLVVAEKEAKTAVAEPKALVATDQKRICKMDVFYNWTPERSLKIKSSEETLKRYFGTIMDEGFEDEEIRMRLLGRVSSVSADAMSACTKMHQEKSICLADRLREISKRFARYDYPRRKMLVEAAERDCFVGAGECISVVVGEVECWGNASPDSPSLADFVPVTFATPLATHDPNSIVSVSAEQIAPEKNGDVLEVKRKQVLKATAPKVIPPVSKDESEPTPADKGFNSPFVVD